MSKKLDVTEKTTTRPTQLPDEQFDKTAGGGFSTGQQIDGTVRKAEKPGKLTNRTAPDGGIVVRSNRVGVVGPCN